MTPRMTSFAKRMITVPPRIAAWSSSGRSGEAHAASAAKRCSPKTWNACWIDGSATPWCGRLASSSRNSASCSAVGEVESAAMFSMTCATPRRVTWRTSVSTKTGSLAA